MPRVLFYLLICCFALATPLSAQPQITTGVIQGTVMDSTGAVLPSCSRPVTIRSSMVMMPSILLSGFIFPREEMPLPIYLLTFTIPITYFIEILRGVILRGAQLMRSEYESAQHLKMARKAGVSEAQIEHLPSWRTSNHFDERETRFAAWF
jgi:hypothetical protein